MEATEKLQIAGGWTAEELEGQWLLGCLNKIWNMTGKYDHVEEDLKRNRGRSFLDQPSHGMHDNHTARRSRCNSCSLRCRSRAVLIVSLIRSNPERSDNATPAGVVDSHASHSYLGSIKYLRDLPDVSELRCFTWGAAKKWGDVSHVQSFHSTAPHKFVIFHASKTQVSSIFASEYSRQHKRTRNGKGFGYKNAV